MTDWQQLDAALEPWRADSEEPSLDEIPAHARCMPADVDQLQQVLRLAAAESAAVYPVGGATASDYGRRASAEGIAVCTGNLDRLVDYPARDMTITVEAGMTMDRLAGLLAEENQRLPVDVADSDRATLGGVLATNTSGPRRYGYGTWRDYVIGIGAVDAVGSAFKAGGRVVKNVAGYDLCKLLVGSLGTLGIITQVTLKVRPEAESSAIVWARAGSDLGAIDAMLERLATSQTRPVCIELLNRAAAEAIGQGVGGGLPVDDYVLVVGFEGTAKAVGWQAEKLVSELGMPGEGVTQCRDAACQPAWQSLTGSVAAAPACDSRLTFKANLPPSKVCDFFQQCTGHSMALQSHAGNGIVEGRLSNVWDGPAAEAILKPLRALAVAAGGNLVVLRCPGAWKEHLPVWGHARGDWELMGRLKRKLDPKGLLNPGRFVDGLIQQDA